MFGGADPTIDGLVPADIEIVGNHLAKPLSWRIDDPHFQGTAWTVKNLFELKNARRVLVDGNLFEYNWPHAQNGFAILFTPRNQDGRSPWSVVEDVTFVNNLVRHVAAGINVLGHDDIHSSQPTRRIAIANNLFRGRRRHVGSRGACFSSWTARATSRSITTRRSRPTRSSRAAIARRTRVSSFRTTSRFTTQYGVIGSGTGIGRPTLDRYFPGAVIRRNVIIGGMRRSLSDRTISFRRPLTRSGSSIRRAATIRLEAVELRSNVRPPTAWMSAPTPEKVAASAGKRRTGRLAR